MQSNEAAASTEAKIKMMKIRCVFHLYYDWNDFF